MILILTFQEKGLHDLNPFSVSDLVFKIQLKSNSNLFAIAF